MKDRLATAKIVGRLDIDKSTSQRGNYTAKDATGATVFRVSYHTGPTQALAEKRAELLVALVNREIDVRIKGPEMLVEWEAMKGWQAGDAEWSTYYTRWDRDTGLRNG